MIWIGSGHGIDPHVTPIYKRGGGAPSGPFYSSPFVLYAATYEGILGVAVGRRIKFRGDNSGRLQVNYTSGIFVDVPDIPLQLYEGLPADPGPALGWKARLAENTTGDGTEFESSPAGNGTGDQEGVWFDMGANPAWFLYNTAPATFTNISVYELALSDEIVKARATIVLRNRY
jgi:hypothetical protein